MSHQNEIIMAKKETRGRKKLSPLKKKQVINLMLEGALIKRHGGKVAVVEKCKQFLEEGD